MKNILVIFTTAFVSYGGLTTVMMNYYRAMDKTGLKIDFASTNEAPQDLLAEIQNNGSEYYCLGSRKKTPLKYRKNLKNLLKRKKYDGVHVNGNSATMYFELSIAKRYSVPVRIAHGHNTQTDYSIFHRMLEPAFRKSYTHAVAVSQKVGDWLYRGKQYSVLNNAIDLEKYKFNEDTRIKVRSELKIEDKFVVGNIGKLNQQKNHIYLLNVFVELKKIRNNVCLLLVGGGPLEYYLKKECIRLGIDKNVIFMGMVDNSAEYLQAMDICIFPSLWEGLPLAVIEAQSAGLPCIVSKNVTKEVKCLSSFIYKDLSDGVIDWAYVADKQLSEKIDRTVAVNNMRASCFNIQNECGKLRKIYLDEKI